jgi:hypothetical protein
VDFDPGQCSRERLAAAVRDAGYEVR